MKRIFWIVPLLVTTSLFAQSRGVSVTLEATPASVQTVNSETVLKATVSTSALPAGALRYNRDRLRFTFTLQRNWPCPKTITLGDVRATSGDKTTHVATYPWSWNPINAGEYTFSVDVTHLGLSRPGQPQLLERLGSATIAKYTAKPAAGWAGNVGTNFSPSSPAAAPVSQLYLNVSLTGQPGGTWYRYQYWCTSGCQPGTAMKNNQPTSTSFQLAIPNPGSYRFDIGVDRVSIKLFVGRNDRYPRQSVLLRRQRTAAESDHSIRLADSDHHAEHHRAGGDQDRQCRRHDCRKQHQSDCH
jgi:hypothetical protein